MATLHSLSINLSKIDKDKIIQGKKGKYLDITVAIQDQKDEYGNNVKAWHSQSKQEVGNKEEKQYLGNGRVFWTDDPKPTQPTPEDYPTQNTPTQSNDLPF